MLKLGGNGGGAFVNEIVNCQTCYSRISIGIRSIAAVLRHWENYMRTYNTIFSNNCTRETWLKGSLPRIDALVRLNQPLV